MLYACIGVREQTALSLISSLAGSGHPGSTPAQVIGVENCTPRIGMRTITAWIAETFSRVIEICRWQTTAGLRKISPRILLAEMFVAANLGLEYGF